MNYLMVLAIWMAMPHSSTNLFWSSLERAPHPSPGAEFSGAEKHLRERGLPIRHWTGAGFGESAKTNRVIWVIVAGQNEQEIDSASLALLDGFVQEGGSILILVRSEAASAGARSLLRHYRIALNAEPVPAKTQLLSTSLLQGLRYCSPKTRLLDASEEALNEMILVPNELKQPTQNGAPNDRPGFRMILGKRAPGRIAVITGAEAFSDAAVNATHQDREIKNNNLEILLRVCLWLGAS
ncbi:MAG: hypothetical protein EXS30_06160 [Pedosphaera sp.]|nr:hypothetical protein [Pedosphaera sp.]